MFSYNFIIRLKSFDEDQELDRLFEATGGDALAHSVDGAWYVDIGADSDTVEGALKVCVSQLKAAGLSPESFQLDDPQSFHGNNASLVSGQTSSEAVALTWRGADAELVQGATHRQLSVSSASHNMQIAL